MSQLNLIPLRPVSSLRKTAIRAKNAWVSAPWRINAGQTLSLRLREPVCLRVNDGRLWVTQDGVSGGLTPGDHFVGRGQTLQLGRGRVVIECCGRSGAQWRFEALPAALPAVRGDSDLERGFLTGLLLAARSAASKAMRAQSRITGAGSGSSGRICPWH
jgi:Protein of unknown function (DUF2917)